ncbi:unnamed protein product [Zymoseptoria tritici ST99CH_1E4]|uniref:Uncharacterized protein n=1 Tax=Zymoseptoria tritici ST99CH_1E4 TaxID=1276532 RepID=A0A2H1G6T6_ZYMTR|nr:unnamed protein product [Zymoseptoria tritici ST99CH_1E4]
MVDEMGGYPPELQEEDDAAMEEVNDEMEEENGEMEEENGEVKEGDVEEEGEHDYESFIPNTIPHLDISVSDPPASSDHLMPSRAAPRNIWRPGGSMKMRRGKVLFEKKKGVADPFNFGGTFPLSWKRVSLAVIGPALKMSPRPAVLRLRGNAVECWVPSIVARRPM